MLFRGSKMGGGMIKWNCRQASILVLGFIGFLTAGPLYSNTGTALRDEALAGYLVGTWVTQHDADEGSRGLSKYIMKPNGTFEGTMRIFVRGDETKDIWALMMAIESSGTWTVENDVLIETTQQASLPLKEMPYVEQSRIHVRSLDEFEAIDLHDGKRNIARRQPSTTDMHAQAYRVPWPEPSTGAAAWEFLRMDSEGTEEIDMGTMRREGDFARAWVRSTLSKSALRAARAQADALAGIGKESFVMEKTLMHFVVDCARGLIKSREIRSYNRDRRVAGSTYEGTDPMDWDLIGPMDPMEAALRQRVCTSR